jgi:hypothetical protein
MQTVTVDRNTQHLAFLAGELQAAKCDFNRAQADVNTPADVLESLYVEMNIAEDAFRFEFQAVKVLQELAAPEVEPQKPVCDYRVIRRFYAICQDFNLNQKEDERMRGAMSMFFRRRISSRTELTRDNWQAAGDAVKRGLLTW